LSTGRNPDSDPGTPEIYGGEINYHFYCNTELIYTALGAWPPITAFLRDGNENQAGSLWGLRLSQVPFTSIIYFIHLLDHLLFAVRTN
jgi:hypothetical protein